MTECSVCCETMTTSVTCDKCNYTACTKCSKKFLLDKGHQGAFCMSCGIKWDNEILRKNFSDYFLKKEYREMCEKLLFEREKTYLPQLQAEADRRIKREKLEGWIKYYEEKRKENNEKEDQLVSEQRQHEREWCEKIKKAQSLYNTLITQTYSNTKEKKVFLMKCVVENCRGFLSDKYKCGLCNVCVCKDCHKVKPKVSEDEPVHVCDPNEVATITELNKTTKPCPKCQARIYKVDGCDQMFCIREDCRTAFSWRSGEIEKGPIHNPEYFRMLREGKIAPEQRNDRQMPVGCNVMPNYEQIYHILRRSTINIINLNSALEVYRRFVHHRNVTLLQVIDPVSEEDRIKYLMGVYDEKKFKQKIFVRNQHFMRDQEELQIMQTYVSMGELLFQNLTNYNQKTTFEQILNLVMITKDALFNVGKKYFHGKKHLSDEIMIEEANCIVFLEIF